MTAIDRAAVPDSVARLPTATPVGPVDGRRVAGASVGIAVLASVTALVVRALPAGGFAAVVAFMLGAVLLPVVASPLEWFVHRFVYHDAVIRPLRAIHAVHQAHHYSYFPTWRYTTAGPARRLSISLRRPAPHAAPWRNAGVRAAHFGWYLAIGAVLVWAPAWLITGNRAFVAGLVASSLVVCNLFIVVHDTIHRPGSHRIVERQPWFPFLDRHHYVHHVALGVNLNFLLPLADWLFGTLRTELTGDELREHGTLAAAKARPVGAGERARVAIGHEPTVEG